ncbi:MAG: ATP-dependent DNA helicase RecG [Candidatus Saccharibacteria bacterium]
MDINTDLSQLKGVGQMLKEHFGLIGLKTIGDLIEYYPRRYDDYSHISSIATLRPGLVSLKAHFYSVTKRRARRGLHITEAVADDGTGKIKVIWFNQPYRAQSIKKGQDYYISGQFAFQYQRLQIINPSIELADVDTTINTAKILPTYKESGQITSLIIRKLIAQTSSVIDDIPDNLPGWVSKKYDLMNHSLAIKTLHMPESTLQIEEAKKRLGLEELFVVMMAAKQLKDEAQSVKALKIPFDKDLAIKFVEHLPFILTDAQRKAVWQIYKDINQDEPMNRLIEGDVGSGKTVVAAMSALMAIEAGQQVAFVAPTELLAKQHANTMAQLFKHTKNSSKMALLTGSVKNMQKTEIKANMKRNKISLVIGTHALFQETVDWHRLGLVIIDEQHRFGVEQRQKLIDKAGHMPHVLCLTATPIPRSLALTVYGELSVSILDQAPNIRAGTETVIVSPNSTAQMFEKVNTQLDSGRQAYIVCPLITDSEKLDVVSAEKLYKELKQKQLKKWRVGLLHGRMKTEQKDAAMKDFVDKKIDVMVATTVIEVGVDVANATEMVIYSADRFGLAQLHQLRGRVGRAQHKGHCYLVMSDSANPSKRMQAIATTDNGFKLAELDLEIRGPGAIYGVRQHGMLDLRIAKLTDINLINLARQVVIEFINQKENLLKYKQIAVKIQRATKLTYLN